MKRSHMALALLGLSYLLPFLAHCGKNEEPRASSHLSASSCVVDEKLETYSCFEWQGQDTGSRGFECTATGGKVSYQTCDRSKAARGCKQETAASIDGKTYRETYVYWWGRDSQISCLGEELTTDGQPLALSKKHAPKASS